MAFFRNTVAACVRQETGQGKHRTSLSEQPVCSGSIYSYMVLSLLNITHVHPAQQTTQKLIDFAHARPTMLSISLYSYDSSVLRNGM